MRRFIFYLLIFLGVNCTQSGEKVDTPLNLQKFHLQPVDIELELPGYYIKDSVKYGIDNLLNYHIESKDSLFKIICMIHLFPEPIEYEQEMRSMLESQRHEAQYGKQILSKYKDAIIGTGKTKIVHLQYLVSTGKEKLLESRIAFIVNNKRVVIWFFENFERIVNISNSISEKIANQVLMQIKSN